MIINIVYLIVGILVGFIVKHEIDIKLRKKRAQSQQEAISEAIQPFDETLCIIKELNASLLLMQRKQNKEVG